MDLELADTDELLRELLSRFDHGVIALMRVKTDEPEPGYGMWRNWVGNRLTCIGLLQDAQRAILDDLREGTVKE